MEASFVPPSTVRDLPASSPNRPSVAPPKSPQMGQPLSSSSVPTASSPVNDMPSFDLLRILCQLHMDSSTSPIRLFLQGLFQSNCLRFTRRWIEDGTPDVPHEAIVILEDAILLHAIDKASTLSIRSSHFPNLPLRNDDLRLTVPIVDDIPVDPYLTPPSSPTAINDLGKPSGRHPNVCNIDNATFELLAFQ
ncbi:hypothetical protein Scep_014266 [Stephania cephalantha]|uniref:Uncharacterized protein n=1 Tax=Stephania cephalantha TaxID=152367 RepID=A0AAP0J1P2_9MAGN